MDKSFDESPDLDLNESFDENPGFYDTYKLQNFSLPLQPYIILDNANHMVLKKLFETCKYFFDKKPTPICYKLILHLDGNVLFVSLFEITIKNRIL